MFMKTNCMAHFFGMLFVIGLFSQSNAQASITEKLSRIDLTSATLSDIIDVFGKPKYYHWGGKTYTKSKSKLPAAFVISYSNDFHIFITGNKIGELRFEGPGTDYVFEGKLKVGSRLDTALKVVGQPDAIVRNSDINFNRSGVLYTNIPGKKGLSYYHRPERGIRLFFYKNIVVSMYIIPITREKDKTPISEITFGSINSYEDVSGLDLRNYNFTQQENILFTLRFDEKTLWPEQLHLPKGFNPKKLLEDAMNPGLKVRQLHKQGIIGKGVNVAIIDQPMFLNHPEFKGKIVAYHNIGCDQETSAHGPAMTSLLVGERCGTAPGAKIYYVAVPSWLGDAEYYAQAVDWIIEQSKKLSYENKIRAISVSAAPSGPNSLFTKNLSLWDQAREKAEAEGILILDCTQHKGFIRGCRLDRINPNNPDKCIIPLSYLNKQKERSHRPDSCYLYAPMSPRTVAQQNKTDEFNYQYLGDGGLSCSIPYVAGVLAMAWQVRPDLTAKQMTSLVMESAHLKQGNTKIIQPIKFIESVRRHPR